MAVNGLTCTAQIRRVFGRHYSARSVLLYGLILIISTPGFLRAAVGATTTEPSLPSDSINENDARRICPSMDIRNSLESFKKLENCEVIEGFLSILLFDNLNETEMSKISFPLLTEITDYLLLYRVNGLRSVGQLFPNLSVIRGQSMFLEHALVIFEMPTLQEIGLYSLTDISRGHVHIDKNPSLCFVHTIDWDKIVKDKTSKNFVKSLKPENECPVCPATVGTGNNTVRCPSITELDGKERHLCWNKNQCQKICGENCTHCNNKRECCHHSCLACRDDNPNICTVCPYFSYGHDLQKTCRKKCPKDLYGYLNRRCINREQCLKTHKPIELQTTNYVPEPYKIYQESCILECPPDYTEKNSTCIHCGGRCKKSCLGMKIDSIAGSKQLMGCTHIEGNLEIQIRGGANITELEENLKMIEVITGYLKVVRSFSLLSLNFLKNLRELRGQKLDSEKYVFSVLDNQNLQDLWDWSVHPPLKISSGKLFFHFNPKLCFEKIVELQQKTGLANFTDLEVASNSNGDKTACNIELLNVTVKNVQSNSSTLEWKSFHLDDQRKLLAYIISYVETPYKNVTQYYGKDACGQDNWKVVDVSNKEEENITYVIKDLKPYTQYAFYVKTYTIASERNGAQSHIQFFRTLASKPMQPMNLNVNSNASDSLIITWLPPTRPNGPITYYNITITKQKEHNDVNYVQEYNYCNDNTPKEETHSTQRPLVQYNCQCETSTQNDINIDESEETERIKFEDELINQVYLKRPKREIMYSNANKTFKEPQNVQYQSINVTDSENFFITFITNETKYFVNKLHHYTMYNIQVRACRPNECSEGAMKSSKTKEKVGADRISNLTLTHKTQDSVTVSWKKPTDPNGNIYAYTIQYKRVDIDNAKAFAECLNVSTNNTTLYYTVGKLIPGNYSLCIYARSAANRKEQSKYIYFYIEEPSSNTALIISTLLFIFLIGMIFFVWLYRKAQKKPVLVPKINPEYVPNPYVKDEWEVPREKIIMNNELGQGSFGMVWEGVARDIRGKPEVRCAVKTVNVHATDRERLEFLNEASVMKAFDTTHVVRLLGVVSEGQPTLVIMELMANGDLKSYLRSHRPDMENYNPTITKHPPSLKQILQMAIEIADGMAYLSAKKFVHRDLAARNCMVSEELVVKIGDFGMTRDIYETDYYRKGTKGLLPVRWMAPESLKDGVFTSSSDVWSYGVVLWEMATLASQPYQGLANDQVLRYVIDGGVMERPENCPDKLYTLMRYCWQHKPSSRPTFLKLCQLLLEDASPTFSVVSFYHSPAGIEARASRHTPSPSQDDQTTPLRIVAERLRGFMPSLSQDSDDLDIDTHHQFPSISESGGVITTANGYVSGCPTNGAATTQC